MKVSYQVKWIIITAWLSSLYTVPLLIFVKGLLLYREVLPNQSFCKNDSFSACFTFEDDIQPRNCFQYYNSTSEGQYCVSTRFKVILIVIDALRFDFVEHQRIEHPAPYHNKLKFVTGLLESRPQNTRLFQFIADPPTTTMQRIKGLTTGSLPTFIDIGSNFASSEINEDNIIDIIKREQKNIVFLGDDTWTKLYPGKFIRSFAFDSFNVWDLDTVDRGIQENLINELRKTDWNLMIAHFLGVDHCGHRYGPNHPEMERKLKEMDSVIENIVSEIGKQDDVVLFVIGDHGMTSTGDHGGETGDEVTTALFVYSPFHSLFDDFIRSSRAVSQVDLVPTLSTILGVPTPFSNTGRIVFECIPTGILNSVTSASFVLWQNVEQITNYVNEYLFQNGGQFESTAKDEILQRHTKLRQFWYSLQQKDFRNFVNEYEVYMKSVLAMCQKVWVQFDELLIVIGILLMGLVSILCIGLVVTYVEIIHVMYSLIVLAVGLLFLEAHVAAIGYEVFSLVCLVGRCYLPSISSIEGRDLFIFFCALCQAVSLFSNSFIVEEASVFLFFVISCLCVLFLSNAVKNFKIFMTTLVVYRLAFYAVRCGEARKQCKDITMEDQYSIKYTVMTAVMCAAAMKSWSEETGSSKCRILFFLVKACMLLMVVGDVLKQFAFVERIPALVLLVSSITMCVLGYDPLMNSTGGQNRARVAWINISMVVCVACGALLGSSLMMASVCMVLGLQNVANFTNRRTGEVVCWSWIVLWQMSAVYWFHATGNYASFSAISWKAAFIFEKDIGSSRILPGALVIMNTFVAYIVHGLLLTSFLTCSRVSKFRSNNDDGYWPHFVTIHMKYITVFALRLLAMMVSCALHSRHLMMWQIFAPKLIFDSIAFLVTIASSMLGFFFANAIYR